jgi:CheY-like chemotaxis protein
MPKGLRTDDQARTTGATPSDDLASETSAPAPAPTHELDRVREARRSAAASGAESRAVRAQAAQQQRRSQRNIASARLRVRRRVLVVDDSEVFRQTAASLVSAARGVHLVGVAASGEEAIRLLPQLNPDLVLLDVQMPGLNGLETAPLIRQQSPNTVVVLVSADPGSIAVDPESVGAAGFLSKAALSPRKLEEIALEHLSGS